MKSRTVKKSHISVNGYFSSFKNQRQINFESKLEHDFYLLLEFDNSIESYQEQPFQIYYSYKNKKRKYTPDTLVNYIDGTQKVFEVKPQFKIETDIELQEKLELQKQKIQTEMNLELCIFTDSHIDKTYLNNIKAIYNCAFIKENFEIQNAIKQEILKLHTSITINELLDRLTKIQNERLRFIPYIWKMVFQNIDCIDLTSKLTMASRINPRVIQWED